MKKSELNQDKRELLLEQHQLATRLQAVVRQIDELIAKKESGQSR